jgi:hypothetical protein
VLVLMFSFYVLPFFMLASSDCHASALLEEGLSYVVTNSETTYLFVVQSSMHEMGRRNLRHAGKPLLLFYSCD